MQSAVVVGVEHMFDPACLTGRLESPVDNARLIDGDMVLAGWALGTDSPATAIELAQGRQPFKRIALDQVRPDVSSAFPQRLVPVSTGFRAELQIAEVRRPEFIVRVALRGGGHADLARVKLREAPLLDPETLLPPPVGEYDLTTKEAIQRYQSSPAMRWAKLIDDEPPPGSAWQRISDNDIFEPLIRPGFTISRRDRVFTIGSCFARAVEGALAGLGMDVVSRTVVFDKIPMRALGRPTDFTNKYNTEAVRNELRWALEPDTHFPHEGLVMLPGGTYQDPYASSNLEFADEVDTLARHRHLTELAGKAADCRIIVITLGLIEAFFDTKTGLFTNTTPHLTADPARFRFRILSYDQVMEGLEEIHRLLSAHGHPDVQIVVTVSPIPLEATFTGEDVVIANTLSKSVLRASAAAWARGHENVHYFPSYEIVMNSSKQAAWRKDGRHVRQDFVGRIMELFVRTHMSADDAASLTLVGHIAE